MFFDIRFVKAPTIGVTGRLIAITMQMSLPLLATTVHTLPCSDAQSSETRCNHVIRFVLWKVCNALTFRCASWSQSTFAMDKLIATMHQMRSLHCAGRMKSRKKSWGKRIIGGLCGGKHFPVHFWVLIDNKFHPHLPLVSLASLTVVTDISHCG